LSDWRIASKDEQVAVGIIGDAAHKDRNGLTIRLDRIAQVPHIRRVEAILHAVIHDVRRIQLPDMMTIDSIARGP
jgi:hypothetical protein